MGLITAIPRILSKGLNYSTRAAKVAPDIIFGKGAETFVNSANKVTKGASESWLSAIGRAIKTGGKAVEADVAATKAVKGGFFKQAWNSLRTAPKVIGNYTKAGVKLAGIKGSSKIMGGIKGFFKGVGKKMPLIGNLLLVAFSLPDIIGATKEKGLFAGIKEAGNAGARLAGGALGGALLAPIIPPFGSIIGWCLGEWITGKVVGKTYGEKKAEEEAKVAELIAMEESIRQQQAQMQPQIPVNGAYPPFNGNPFNYPVTNPVNNYENDVMFPPQFNTIA